MAGAFRVFGESVTVLRAVSGMLGVLAVLALFPLLRRFSLATALGGMAWAAGSLWLICVSRDGMRNILVPLFGALLLWGLLRWAERPDRASSLVAGAVAGAGLWTYQPLKLTPLLVLLWLAWIRRADRPLFERLRRTLPWAALAYVAVAFPLLLTAVVEPAGYFGRAAGVSLFNPANSGINLVDHTLRTLGMFALDGDPNARHNVGGLPLLGWPLLVLAGAGGWRAWRRRIDAPYSLLLIGIPVFLMPPLLGVDGGSPHFLRSLGLAPFLAGLIGLGCQQAIDLGLGAGRQRGGAIVAVGLGLLLGGLALAGARAYFLRPLSARFAAYSYAVVAMARQAGPGDAVIVDDYDAIDIDFLDAGHEPRVFSPGTSIPHPERFGHILALRREDLAQSLGTAAAANARPATHAPDGTAALWVSSP